MNKNDVKTIDGADFLGAVAGIIAIVLFFIVGLIVLSFVTAWAWNGFTPAIFDLPRIDQYQAFSMLVFLGIIRGIFFTIRYKGK